MQKILSSALTTSFIFFSAISVVTQTKSNSCEELNPLLSALGRKVGAESKAISKLFQIGDMCIEDLISNLNGSDFQISVAAQEAIRYLGNDKGLKALDSWNRTNKKSYPVRGPVPVPIMDFDYEMIELNFLGTDQKDFGLLTSQYLYALAIDKASSKSKKLFQQVRKKLGQVDKDSVTRRIVDRLNDGCQLGPFSASKNLENAVLENAFFLSDQERQFTTARLLSFNGANDKALIELYHSRGVLAERWYHVVVRRAGSGWEFYSITFIAQS